MNLDEYFDFEERSPTKHEYVDGEVFAMSGVTRRHNQIAGNIFARIWGALRGGHACRAHISDVKLRVGRVVYYPDVMVACGPEPADDRLEDAPCLVVEVLSPSTEIVDRREKLMVYKGVASLGAYLIVSQSERRVDRYGRERGEWRHDVLTDQGSIALPCPELTLTLEEIYEDVELPTPDQWRRLREEELAYPY